MQRRHVSFYMFKKIAHSDMEDIKMEINDYQETALHGSIVNKVHKDDINSVLSQLTPQNLIPYFEGNEVTVSCHLIIVDLIKTKDMFKCVAGFKAQNMERPTCFILYIKNINDQKQNEELLSTHKQDLSSAFLGLLRGLFMK